MKNWIKTFVVIGLLAAPITAWSQQPVRITNLATDAPIGSALTSNPVPMGCHNETSPTAIANTTAGVPECDTSQRLIVVGPGTAGTPAGGVQSVQGVSSGTPMPISFTGTGVDPCQDTSLTKTLFNVRVASSSLTQLIAAQSSKTTFICDLKVEVDGTGETISIVEAAHSSTACDGSQTALEGSTTVANGIAIQAGGGFVVGTGGFAVRKTSATNHEICALNLSTNAVHFTGNWVAR